MPSKYITFLLFLALTLAIFPMVGCKKGCRETAIIGSSDEIPLPPPPPGAPGGLDDETSKAKRELLKQVFASSKQCLEQQKNQFDNSDIILTTLIKNPCFTREDIREINNLRIDIQDYLNILSQDYQNMDEAKLKEEELKIKGFTLADLAQKYNKLQNKIAYCRTKSFVNQPISSEIENELRSGSLLLHAVGDVFGANAGEKFEGNVSENTLKHRLIYIKALKEMLKAQTYIKNEEQANPCQGLSHLPFTLASTESPDFSQKLLEILIDKNETALTLSALFSLKDIGKVRTKLIEEIDKLSVGDSIFMIANWTKHAFLYQIIKDAPDSYTFKIYNSGDGLETYHAMTIKGYEIQFLPFVEASKLTKDAITSLTFLKALNEITIPETYNTKAKDFYEKILFEIGGQPSENVYETEVFKSPQQAGTCSYFSQPWILEATFEELNKKGEFEKESFFPARLELLFGLKTLSDYYKNSKDKAAFNQEQLTLLKKSIVFLSGNTLDASRSGIIDSGFIDALVQVEEPIKASINSLEKQRQQEKEQQSISRINTNIPIDNRSNEFFSSNVQLSREIPKVKPQYIAGKSYTIFDTSAWMFIDPYELLKEITEKVKVQNLEALLRDGATENIAYNLIIQNLTALSKLAQKLPLTKDYWLHHQQQALEIITLLRELQSTYVYNLMKAISSHLRKQKNFTTPELLTVVKFLSLADLINSNFIPEPKLPRLNQKVINQLLFKDIALIETHDADYQKLYEELKAYWQSEENEDTSFFQFEILPAGSEPSPAGSTPGSKLITRRILWDPTASVPENKAHWSDEITWNDLEWAMIWMKRQGGYQQWIDDQINAQKQWAYGDEIIVPFSFSLASAYGYKIINKSKDSYGLHYINSIDSYRIDFNKPDISRISNTILDRRYAARLLSQSSFNEKEPLSLPQIFFDLRQMSYEMNYMLTGRLDEGWARAALNRPMLFDRFQEHFNFSEPTGQTVDRDDYDFNPIRQNTYEYVYKKSSTDVLKNTTYKAFNLTLNIFGHKIYNLKDFYEGQLIDDKKPPVYISPYVGLQEAFMPFIKYKKKENEGVNKFPLYDLMSIYSDNIKDNEPRFIAQEAQIRRRIKPNDLIIIEPEKQKLLNMSLEEVRGLFTMSSFRDFQIIETLALFKKFPSMLLKEEYQRLFKKLMLEPNVFLKQLTIDEHDSEQIVLMLSSFFKDNFERFKDYEDIKAMTFILEINQLLKLQVQYAQQHKDIYKVNDELDQNFLDTPSELLKLSQQEYLSKAQKAFIYANLAYAFKFSPKLSKEDTKNLLLAMTGYGITKITDLNYEDPYLLQEIKNIVIEKQEDIQKNIRDENNRNEILTFVANKLRPDLEIDGSWQALDVANDQKQNFIYQTRLKKGGSLEFNVHSAQLLEAGNPQVPLPLEASAFEKAFGSEITRPELVTRIDNNIYIWNSDKGEIRIKITAGVATIQRVIGDTLYQFADSEKIILNTVKGFSPNYDYWVEINPNPQAKRKVLLLDMNTKEKIFDALIVNDGQKTQLIKMTRLKDKAELLLDDDNDIIEELSRIEDPKYINLWLDQQDKVLEINLPRLALSFKPIENSKYLDCGPHKDYRIAELQYTSSLPGVKNYIICEPSDNKSTLPRIAITPLVPFVAHPKLSSLSNDFTTDFKAIGSNILIPSVTYELPAKEGGEAKPLSSASNYYLALRMWWNHDYKRARSLLISSDAEISRISKMKGEVSALMWLVSGREPLPAQSTKDKAPSEEKLQDKDPRATAVRLLAASILISQYEDYGINKEGLESLITPIARAYMHYLSNINIISAHWLDFYSEWRIINYLIQQQDYQNNFILANRLRYLKYMHPARFKEEVVSKLPAKIEQLDKEKAFNKAQLPDPFSLNTIKKWSEGGDKADDKTTSVLKADAIFNDPTLWELFYNVASANDFDEELAKNTLSKLLEDGGELGLEALSKNDLRKQFTFLFKTNALYPAKKNPQAGNKLARFFEIVHELSTTQQRKFPSWEDIKKEFEKQDELDAQINKNSGTIRDLNQKLSEPKFASKKTEIEARINTLNQKNSEYTKQKQTITNNLEQKLINPVKGASLELCALTPKTKAVETVMKEALTGPKRSLENKDLEFRALMIDPLEESFFNKNPQVKFDDFFNTIDMSDDKKNTLEQAQQDLAKQFSKAQNASEIIRARFDELESSIKSYTDKRKDGKSYSLIPEKITLLENSIKGLKDNAQKMRDDYEKSALELVNTKSSKDSQRSYRLLLQLAEVEKEININDLIYLLITRKISEMERMLSGEQDKKITAELIMNITSYLLESTYVQYLESALKMLNDIEKMDGDTPESELATTKLADHLREKRQYDYKKHIEYLAFEHFVGLHIRKDQIEALDQLAIKNGVINNERALGPVLEMIMGFGKTSVLIPLLSAMNTSGEWLNLIVLPEALIASMSKDLRRDIMRSFNRNVQVLEISRETPITEQSLLKLYDRLYRAHKEGHTIITTNSSVQSLFLSFVDRLHKYNDQPMVYGPQIEVFTSIFQYLRTFGLLTIDEVDLALDILKAHQFSVGNKIPINQTLAQTVYAFYKNIAGNNKIFENLKIPFLAYSKGEPISEDVYKNFKMTIVDEILKDERLFKDFNLLDDAFRKMLKGNLKTYLRDYLSNIDAIKNRSDLFSAIDVQFKEAFRATAAKNIASVLYEEINQTFLITASKKLNIHYGKLPLPLISEDETEKEYAQRLKSYNNAKFIAIPYHAGKPATNSRFGTAIEAANYAIQKALEEKEFKDLVILEIESLKNRRLKIDNDEARRAFDDAFGRIKTILGDKSITLSRLNEEHIDIIANKLKSEGQFWDYALYLIKNHILPQLKTYETQLQTNGQIYQSLFKMVSGFSGTLWSATTFPDIFQKARGSDTAEKTIMLLWLENLQRQKTNTQYQAVREIYEPDLGLSTDRYLDELIDQVYKDWIKPGSLIDLGGVFRGLDNLEVAKRIAQKIPAKDIGVIYYDADDQLMIFEKENNISIPLSATKIPIDKRYAYWPKKQTTGSDLKLGPNMKARITVANDTFSRDLQQAVWRLRGLGAGQAIDEYLIVKNDFDFIKKRMYEVLNLPAASLKNFGLGDLIVYVTVNQELRLSDLLHRSVKHKMTNAIALEANKAMFKPGTPVRDIVKTYNSVSSIFEKNLNQEPYYYIGIPITMAEKEKVLVSDKNRIFNNMVKSGIKDTFSSPENVLEIINMRIDDSVKAVKGLLPNKLQVSEIDSGVEVDIETELEQELEQELETKREIEFYSGHFQPNVVAHEVHQWPKDGLFMRNYFNPGSALFRVKDKLTGEYWQLSQALDEEILASFNFAPVNYKPKSAPYSYSFNFFSIYQKAITNVLVIIDGEDDKTAKIKLIAIDNNDTEQFNDLLINDIKNPALDPEIKVALYSIENGIFRQGNETIDEDDLEQNANFLRLIVQMRFLNGDLFYPAIQRQALKDWLDSTPSIEYMFSKFKERILNYKQHSLELFPNSDIRKIFDDLGVDPEK